MGLGKILILTVLAFLLPSSLRAQEKILVSYDGHSGFQGPIWASKDLGLFEKHGLNAELVMIPGGARAMQALVSGSTHFAQGSATAPISVHLQGGDVAIIATALNKFPFSLVAQKEIVKPADLVGKKIGIVNFGGSNELAVALALKEWNIPRQAVTLLPSGEAATRLIALSTKALDATVLSPPYTAEAVRMGMNILAHMSDMKAAFPQTVITVRRSFLEKNRETVKRFVRAYSEAIYVFITDKERAIAVYTKRLKQKNPQVLDETYGYFAGKFSIPPRADREGVMNVLSSAGQGKGAEPAQFLDESVIEELEREGFYKKLMGAK